MPVTFSFLKHMADSPAHYRHALSNPIEPTASMRIGTYLHELVLGAGHRGKSRVYEGVRRGAAWEAFKAQGGNILNETEAAVAQQMAGSIKANHLVQGMLEDARTEVPLEWEMHGMPCATGGVDIVGRGFIADLKATQNSAPAEFTRQATRMNYIAQLAFYDAGCKANGIDTTLGHYLIGVESSPPYPVTVMMVGGADIQRASLMIATWLTKLKQCQEEDHWPGYTEMIVEYEMPSWGLT